MDSSNSWLTNFKRFKIALLDSFSKPPNAHVSPILAKLHWLPIAQIIDYKISSLCYDVSDTAPPYFSDLLRLYVPSRSLRSSSHTRIFRIPKRKKNFQGERAFSHLGPVTLNKLPILCTPCSNTIPVQNSTKNHTIPLSLRTRLLELVCVFSCSPYFPPV